MTKIPIDPRKLSADELKAEVGRIARISKTPNEIREKLNRLFLPNLIVMSVHRSEYPDTFTVFFRAEENGSDLWVIEKKPTPIPR